MELLMLGHISAFMAWRIANACVQDGLNKEAIVGLSNTGCKGSYPANLQRDINRMIGMGKCQLPDPILIDLPLLNTDKEPPEVTWVKWPFYLAQDLMHTLYTRFKREFAKKLLGSRGALESFWQQMHPDDPRLASHPLKNKGRAA